MALIIHHKPLALAFAPGLDAAALAPLIQQFVPIQDWAKNLDQNLDVQSIEVQSVDLFGKRIGFLKVKAVILNKQNQKPIPGIIFFRGDAVAILPIIQTPSQKLVMLTEQYRAPLGRKFLEIPAGMCDGDGNFSGVAIKEMEEETGLHLNASQLVDLGHFVPSIGACDEKLHLFCLEIKLSEQQMADMKTRIYGEGDHEVIRLKFVTFDEAWALEDSKLLAALARWSRK